MLTVVGVPVSTYRVFSQSQKEISSRSSRRMDAGLESTGFLLFDLFEIAYISCVRICVCVCGGIGTCTGFVFHYLFVLFPVFGRLVVSPPQVQVVFCYFRCTTMFLFSYR